MGYSLIINNQSLPSYGLGGSLEGLVRISCGLSLLDYFTYLAAVKSPLATEVWIIQDPL